MPVIDFPANLPNIIQVKEIRSEENDTAFYEQIEDVLQLFVHSHVERFLEKRLTEHF